MSDVEIWLILLPQKMHFRTWMFKDSNRWLLIKKLAYKYYWKTMLSTAECNSVEILLISVYSKNMWSLLVHSNHYKKSFSFFLSYYIRMIILSLNELKLIVKSRNIKDYKSKAENDSIKYSANQSQKEIFLKIK